jgi:hypothetical protein
VVLPEDLIGIPSGGGECHGHLATRSEIGDEFRWRRPQADQVDYEVIDPKIALGSQELSERLGTQVPPALALFLYSVIRLRLMIDHGLA